MSPRLPRIATATAPAELPPIGLDGLDPSFSRLIEVPSSVDGRDLGWHLLDNGPLLEARGIRPVGTVLCVHGNPTWSYLWRQLVTAATDAAVAGAGAWRVIAVDQLEMGFSERTGQRRALAQRVRDLGDLTDELGLDGPVVTLGHDWGGVVSLGWAVDHRDALAGVMVLNTAVHQEDDVSIPASLRLALGTLSATTVTTPAFLETTLALAHPPLSAAVKRGYRAPYRTAARRGGIGGFVADIPVDGTHESRPELDRIAGGIRHLDAPALMLWGPRDPIFSDRYLDDLMERMPQADVHRFEGAGHLVAEDRDYVTPVLDWLGDLVVGFAPHGTAATSLRDASEPAAWAHAAPSSRPTQPSVSPRPLWHYLDELDESADTALIELGGGVRTDVSWRLLSRRVRQLAAGFDRIGVRKGHRVSLLIPPGADLTLVLYACLRIGAVVVVADAGLGLRGLTRAVRGARADWVIGAPPGLTAARALGWPGRRISTARYPRAVASALGVSASLGELIRSSRPSAVRRFRTDASDPASVRGNGAPSRRHRRDDGAERRGDPQPHDTAAVLFTSGSTGPAKGVVYTHAQLAALCTTLATQYGIAVGTGLVAGFAPFALLSPAIGARSVTPDMDVTAPRTLTATAVAEAVAAAGGGVVFLSPAAIANVVATSGALDAAGRDALAAVRTFLSAGAPVSPTLLSAAQELMPNAAARTPYGMTEGLLMTDISLDQIRQSVPTAAGGVIVGTPVDSVRVRISALDDHGRAVGEPTEQPELTGEILVSAPHVEDHYDKLWITDRASRHGTPDGERWHRTGDVGHLDSDGRLWVEGRLPHVISTADGPVTPVGPEQRIGSLDGVASAAVVGVGPAGTQQVVAVVVTTRPPRRPTLADGELAASVRLVAGMPIAAVLSVPALPTDIRHNSKIDRARVGQWAAGILSGGRMSRLSTKRP